MGRDTLTPHLNERLPRQDGQGSVAAKALAHHPTARSAVNDSTQMGNAKERHRTRARIARRSPPKTADRRCAVPTPLCCIARTGWTDSTGLRAKSRYRSRRARDAGRADVAARTDNEKRKNR